MDIICGLKVMIKLDIVCVFIAPEEKDQNKLRFDIHDKNK